MNANYKMNFTVEIPLFMLWESARPSCLTSDNWEAAFTALQAELKREITEDGSTRVYQMLEGCLERLTEEGHLRKMTDREIQRDAPCPFYDSKHPLPKIDLLQVGEEISYLPPTPFGSVAILKGKIERIYRDREGERVFFLGDKYQLVPSSKVLLPD